MSTTIYPYKFNYSLEEFWGNMIQSTMYKNWKKANPKEAEAMERSADLVINPPNASHTIMPLPPPVKTFFGIALAQAILTLPGNPQGYPNQPWETPEG